ncbi:hypothetical protein B0A65_20535 [Flavobacterium frigidimaris]|uniref:Chaperone of endosialidase n=2 Tax=Flavobacterium frigidimaris TaxID=262320 RepID=A0ABX4BKN3_FLAFR|nr:hypothetical protein B0A65_20535 [Flavobacterium frigidimaris]
MYSANLTLSPWGDNSGDKNHQLNFNNGGVFYRNAFPQDPQWGNWQQLIMANSNGNVAIGKDNSSSKLEINESSESKPSGQLAPTKSILKLSRNGSTNYTYNENAEFRIGHGGSGVSGSKLELYVNGSANTNSIPDQQVMTWNYDGNVGIGTTNPTSKLTVAGNINSREVKVTVDAGADFVFENNYNLPSLDAVDQYIKENKHLPEIASADEMKKEGINLSEMNIKLLQKIEEMTLYLIEQNKKIIHLENRLKKVENN